ncbi:hypothetical protein LEN26_006910 [Aphanomyces euteiches]|nr:hypothetical protein LEN26_006910 [Aphanomyces euteiches]
MHIVALVGFLVAAICSSRAEEGAITKDVYVDGSLNVDLGAVNADDTDKAAYVLSPEQVSQIQALMATDDVKEEIRDKSGGSAVANNAFPGDLRGLQSVNKIVHDQIGSLLKATGTNLPKDIDSKLSPEKVQAMLTWYNMSWIAFNMVMRYLFGDGMTGAVTVGLLCTSVFFVVPWLWRMRKHRQMTAWLTNFYTEHAPANVIRVPKAVEAYASLPNGFAKLKEDCIRKYVVEAKKDK